MISNSGVMEMPFQILFSVPDWKSSQAEFSVRKTRMSSIHWMHVNQELPGLKAFAALPGQIAARTALFAKVDFFIWGGFRAPCQC
jgi:hypothetical protein